MMGKKMTEPTERSSLGDTSVANQVTGEMVGDKNPRRFTLETAIVSFTFRVLGLEASKREVDRETLERDGSMTSRISASRLFGLLALDTRRASVQYLVHVFELRNSFDMLVSMEKVVNTRVAKTLVPEKTGRFSFDGIDRRILGNVLVKR